MDIEQYAGFISMAATSKAGREELHHIALELLDEVDRLQKLLANMEKDKAQQIVALLHEMPWTVALHGPNGEVGDVFFIERWDKRNHHVTEYNNDLLAVLQEAKEAKWLPQDKYNHIED